MRIIRTLLFILFTVALVFALDHKWGKTPPLGSFLSPQQGFWQNAEPEGKSFSQELKFKELKGKASVYLDERLVPHVFAEQEQDAYFIQGWLHAKFRLWQMEFQTLAAAGRVSEKLGDNPAILHFDREQRRLGMVYAAENTLKAVEHDAVSKNYYDAYTAGVNEYINSLSESELPVEYKLLDYKPEPWTNLKIALFLKLMSKDLAGFERDLEFTNTKSVLNLADMRELFSDLSDSSMPIISKGTRFDPPGIVPVKPATADSLYFLNDTTVNIREVNKPNPDNGSNNWAISGDRTHSGAPILCNDPHLGLSLPSIWYEMQITTPTMNVYGATFPGSPSVIIGFNDNIAFGFTNAMRDVKDYFQVRFKDASKKEYWYNGAWKPSTIKIEEIKIAAHPTFYDTVAYTVFGPVMYDESFTNDVTGTKAIAVKWIAHESSNEGAMWFKLNRAKNYHEFVNAIKTFDCPGQNMLFASKSGDIGLWQQGKFPARWEGQGLYIMPGEDSSYDWQGYIPQEENPHIFNPAQGFIFSANQRPVDSTYPYFIPGNYLVSRGRTIYKNLENLQNITPQMMMGLQNNYYDILAADAVPLLLKYVDQGALSEKGRDYLDQITKWNYYSTPDSKAMTIYNVWIDSLQAVIFNDEFSRIKKPYELPEQEKMIEILLRDSASKFIDDINTPAVENLYEQVTRSFKLAVSSLAQEESQTGLLWWKHKKPVIRHLLREGVMPFARRNLAVGGWRSTPNAITTDHGPSWRMIVELSEPIVAYGVYPGGQSGNPGSRFYENFIDDWAAGRYYPLWVMKQNEANDKRVKWTINFSNS
jgi:penicillin G amidase